MWPRLNRVLNRGSAYDVHACPGTGKRGSAAGSCATEATDSSARVYSGENRSAICVAADTSSTDQAPATVGGSGSSPGTRIRSDGGAPGVTELRSRA